MFHNCPEKPEEEKQQQSDSKDLGRKFPRSKTVVQYEDAFR
jgi:hypothetical protein